MKKYLLILTILFSGLTIYAATPEESIQQAKAKYAAGSNQEAIAILDSALAANPNNAQIKKVIADICVDSGETEYSKHNWKNAFEYFKKAVKMMPTHPIATERYWQMKQEFDVNNLKNEYVAPTVQPVVVEPTKVETAPTGKTPAVVVKEDPKAKKGKETPAMLEDSYNKRMLQMEERFNKRMIDMMATQKTKTTEKAAEKSVFDNVYLLIALAVAVIVSILLMVISIVALKKFFDKRKIASKGKKEFETLFAGEKASANYNDLIRMQNLSDMVNKIKSGELDWFTIKKNIGELDRELRLEILTTVENKLERERMPLSQGQAELLMALLFDGDDYLRKRVNLLLNNQYNRAAGPMIPGGGQLSLGYGGQASGTGERPSGLLLADHSGLAESSIMADLNIVAPLSKIVDRKVFKDNHSQRVGGDCYIMAGLIGLSADECNLYYLAGLIHDIGYLDISSDIFNKRKSLTEEEFEMIKKHTTRGVELIDFTDVPDVIKDGILYHHEKWGGGGYPEGLNGDEIPLIARVISLFDVYEALITPRPQRPAFPVKEAVKTIKKGAGNLFDPQLIPLFEQMYKENVLSKEDPWKK